MGVVHSYRVVRGVVRRVVRGVGVSGYSTERGQSFHLCQQKLTNSIEKCLGDKASTFPRKSRHKAVVP